MNINKKGGIFNMKNYKIVKFMENDYKITGIEDVDGTFIKPSDDRIFDNYLSQYLRYKELIQIPP